MRLMDSGPKFKTTVAIRKEIVTNVAANFSEDKFGVSFVGCLSVFI